MFATHPEDTVSNVSDLFDLFERRWTVSDPALFRGEPARFTNNLCPSAFRTGEPTDEFETYSAAFAMYKQSNDRDYMFDRLFPNTPPDSLASIALLQHYGTSTRLLDVSFNPLVALYFATVSHEAEDGFVFAHFGNYLDVARATSERSLASLLRTERYGDYRPRQDTLLLYRPEWHNTRSAAQTGAFLFTKGFVQYIWGGAVFRVPADRKPAIQKQLARFAITQDHLFPE
jgi:hypothetical protein